MLQYLNQLLEILVDYHQALTGDWNNSEIKEDEAYTETDCINIQDVTS